MLNVILSIKPWTTNFLPLSEKAFLDWGDQKPNLSVIKCSWCCEEMWQMNQNGDDIIIAKHLTELTILVIMQRYALFCMQISTFVAAIDAGPGHQRIELWVIILAIVGGCLLLFLLVILLWAVSTEFPLPSSFICLFITDMCNLSDDTPPFIQSGWHISMLYSGVPCLVFLDTCKGQHTLSPFYWYTLIIIMCW